MAFLSSYRPYVFVLALAAILAQGGESRAAASQEVINPDVRAAMVPHKAQYDIKMVARHSGAQVLNISGKMSFEWQPGCEGWTTDHHFDLRYDYADGPPMVIASDFSTYESFDGTQFNFVSQRARDGAPYEEVRGNATATQAVYTVPENLKYDLPPGSYFPMAHTAQTLKLLKDKKKFFNAIVFDGSDDEGPVEINTFLGRSVNAMALMTPSPAVDAELINTPAWAVRMAFFPGDTDETDSDYEMNVVMHDNGIISDMLVEYDDFSVTQKLVTLERLPAESCGEPAEKPNKKAIFKWPGARRP